MASGKFCIEQSNNGKFFFKLCAVNGQVILTSQQYAAKSSAMNGIESVRSNASRDMFEVKEAKDGRHYFNLLAKNKQIIGSSQMYKSRSGLNKGIRSVINNAGDARLDDRTA